MGMETKGYKIGDVAKNLNISQRTVRYYEELGLIATERSSGGYRVYNEAQIERLKTILALKEIGMPLEEISHLIHLRQQGATGSQTAPELLEYLKIKVDKLKNSIEKYSAWVKELEEVIKIVDNCKGCNNPTEEKRCEKCVDIRTDHHVPGLMKTLL